MAERTCIHGMVESLPCQDCDFMDHNQILKVGSSVVDFDGHKGIVVQITEGYDIEDHGCIAVWQSERTEYGADNCEHYAFFGWQAALKIVPSIVEIEVPE